MSETLGEEGADLSLRHVASGHGSAVLLVSGLNGQARFWETVQAALSDRRRVVSFDQRGCGGTPDDGRDWTIEMLAADAFAVAEAAFGTEPFTIIGHSTGGAIAQIMAATRPERVSALVLSGTWLDADAYMHALFDLRLALLDRAPDLDPELGNLLRASPERFVPATKGVALDTGVTRRRIRALLSHAGSRHVAEIPHPALVIGAEDDRVVPPHLSVALHAALRDATLSLLPRGGHFFPQTEPDLFIKTVRTWIAPR